MAEKEKDNIELRSEEVQEILKKPPAWIIRWGITLIFIFTCIIISLMFLIKYPDFISAKIIVTTEEPTERIVARYSGSLAKIYVKNGDSVSSRQKLAVIRNTANIQDVYTLKRILDTIQLNTQNFKFPIDSISNLILGDIEKDQRGW